MSERDSGPALGLLEQIGASALDDDYYLVRPREDRAAPWQRWLTAGAVGVFALTVTIAAVQTQADRPATERQQQALAQDVERRRTIQSERLDRVANLESEVAALRISAGQVDPTQAALDVRAATSAVRGPGVEVRLTPVATDRGPGDVRDVDLQTLVNALWAAGAEAIAVNGRRLGALSSIRLAGSAITVNYDSIDPPYLIQAIGDEDTLETALDDSAVGRAWRKRADDTGLGFSVDGASTVRLAAVEPTRQRIGAAEVVRRGSR